AALEGPTMFDALQQLLSVAPAGVDLSWFARSFNLRAEAAKTLYQEIPMVVVNVAGAGRFGFAPPRWETTQQAVLAALAAEHARVPEVLGLEGRRLRRLATPDLPWEMFTALIDQLLAGQRVAIAELARIVSELAAEKGEVTAAEFRDRIGTGRKLAIRILEYFDKTGFSRRVGDAHRVRDPTLLVEGIKKNADPDGGRREGQVSGRDSHPGGAAR